MDYEEQNKSESILSFHQQNEPRASDAPLARNPEWVSFVRCKAKSSGGSGNPMEYYSRGQHLWRDTTDIEVGALQLFQMKPELQLSSV